MKLPTKKPEVGRSMASAMRQPVLQNANFVHSQAALQRQVPMPTNYNEVGTAQGNAAMARGRIGQAVGRAGLQIGEAMLEVENVRNDATLAARESKTREWLSWYVASIDGDAIGAKQKDGSYGYTQEEERYKSEYARFTKDMDKEYGLSGKHAADWANKERGLNALTGQKVNEAVEVAKDNRARGEAMEGLPGLKTVEELDKWKGDHGYLFSPEGLADIYEKNRYSILQLGFANGLNQDPRALSISYLNGMLDEQKANLASVGIGDAPITQWKIDHIQGVISTAGAEWYQGAKPDAEYSLKYNLPGAPEAEIERLEVALLTGERVDIGKVQDVIATLKGRIEDNYNARKAEFIIGGVDYSRERLTLVLERAKRRLEASDKGKAAQAEYKSTTDAVKLIQDRNYLEGTLSASMANNSQKEFKEADDKVASDFANKVIGGEIHAKAIRINEASKSRWEADVFNNWANGQLQNTDLTNTAEGQASFEALRDKTKQNLIDGVISENIHSKQQSYIDLLQKGAKGDSLAKSHAESLTITTVAEARKQQAIMEDQEKQGMDAKGFQDQIVERITAIQEGAWLEASNILRADELEKFLDDHNGQPGKTGNLKPEDLKTLSKKVHTLRVSNAKDDLVDKGGNLKSLEDVSSKRGELLALYNTNKLSKTAYDNFDTWSRSIVDRKNAKDQTKRSNDSRFAGPGNDAFVFANEVLEGDHTAASLGLPEGADLGAYATKLHDQAMREHQIHLNSTQKYTEAEKIQRQAVRNIGKIGIGVDSTHKDYDALVDATYEAFKEDADWKVAGVSGGSRRSSNPSAAPPQEADEFRFVRQYGVMPSQVLAPMTETLMGQNAAKAAEVLVAASMMEHFVKISGNKVMTDPKVGELMKRAYAYKNATAGGGTPQQIADAMKIEMVKQVNPIVTDELDAGYTSWVKDGVFGVTDSESTNMVQAAWEDMAKESGQDLELTPEIEELVKLRLEDAYKYGGGNKQWAVQHVLGNIAHYAAVEERNDKWAGFDGKSEVTVLNSAFGRRHMAGNGSVANSPAVIRTTRDMITTLTNYTFNDDTLFTDLFGHSQAFTHQWNQKLDGGKGGWFILKVGDPNPITSKIDGNPLVLRRDYLSDEGRIIYDGNTKKKSDDKAVSQYNEDMKTLDNNDVVGRLSGTSGDGLTITIRPTAKQAKLRTDWLTVAGRNGWDKLATGEWFKPTRYNTAMSEMYGKVRISSQYVSLTEIAENPEVSDGEKQAAAKEASDMLEMYMSNAHAGLVAQGISPSGPDPEIMNEADLAAKLYLDSGLGTPAGSRYSE